MILPPLLSLTAHFNTSCSIPVSNIHPHTYTQSCCRMSLPSHRVTDNRSPTHTHTHTHTHSLSQHRAHTHKFNSSLVVWCIIESQSSLLPTCRTGSLSYCRRRPSVKRDGMEDEVRRQERIKENKGRTECEKERGVSEREREDRGGTEWERDNKKQSDRRSELVGGMWWWDETFHPSLVKLCQSLELPRGFWYGGSSQGRFFQLHLAAVSIRQQYTVFHFLWRCCGELKITKSTKPLTTA